MYLAYPASMNETRMSEGLKGGQCGWSKGKGGRVMDDETESGMGLAGDGRSLWFILSATGSHWRVLNRPNVCHFNSTKVPPFHIELYLYHLLVIFNFNREKHLKSQTVKLVIHLPCLSPNLYRVLYNFANHYFTYKG